MLKPDEKAEVKSAIQNKMNRKEFEDAFMAKAQASTHWANFVATAAAFGIGQDAGIAYGAAHNATTNNNLVCLAIAALAVAEEYAIYETLYALAAAGATISLKLLLDRININQNKIIKIFSVVSVALMPPTLLASVWGMNFEHMPELRSTIGYPMAIIVMLISSAIPLIYFRKKGWMK